MIELIEIYTYLISNGWEELCDGEFVSKDWMFKIEIRYDTDESKILIKTAILPLFDRWSNSGSRDYFDTVEDAIKFLKGKYVLSAFREINGMLEETVNNDGIIDTEGYKLILSIIGIFCK